MRPGALAPPLGCKETRRAPGLGAKQDSTDAIDSTSPFAGTANS